MDGWMDGWMENPFNELRTAIKNKIMTKRCTAMQSSINKMSK
jgi:hypothetical protein